PAPPLPSARRLAKTIEVDPELPASFYEATGLIVLGGLALRPDRLERLAAAARCLARAGPFVARPGPAATAAVAPLATRRLLSALGCRPVLDAGEEAVTARPRRRRETDKGGQRRGLAGEGHPFAKLRELKLA